MKIKLILVLFTLFIAGSCVKHSPDKKGNSSFATKEIPVLQIKNKLLYTILDSVINYTQRLYPEKYVPVSIAISDTIVGFRCDTIYANFLYSLNYSPYLGCFKYKNCLFLTLTTNNDWFIVTNKKMSFPFTKYKSAPLVFTGSELIEFKVKENKFTLERKITDF